MKDKRWSAPAQPSEFILICIESIWKQHPIERQSKRMMMGNDDNAIVITGIGKALL
jgi:hypothetical protein